MHGFSFGDVEKKNNRWLLADVTRVTSESPKSKSAANIYQSTMMNDCIDIHTIDRCSLVQLHNTIYSLLC